MTRYKLYINKANRKSTANEYKRKAILESDNILIRDASNFIGFR